MFLNVILMFATIMNPAVGVAEQSASHKEKQVSNEALSFNKGLTKPATDPARVPTIDDAEVRHWLDSSRFRWSLGADLLYMDYLERPMSDDTQTTFVGFYGQAQYSISEQVTVKFSTQIDPVSITNSNSHRKSILVRYEFHVLGKDPWTPKGTGFVYGIGWQYFGMEGTDQGWGIASLVGPQFILGYESATTADARGWGIYYKYTAAVQHYMQQANYVTDLIGKIEFTSKEAKTPWFLQGHYTRAQFTDRDRAKEGILTTYSLSVLADF